MSLLDEIHNKGECVLFWEFRSPQLCSVFDRLPMSGFAPPRLHFTSEEPLRAFALSPAFRCLKMLLTVLVYDIDASSHPCSCDQQGSVDSMFQRVIECLQDRL